MSVFDLEYRRQVLQRCKAGAEEEHAGIKSRMDLIERRRKMVQTLAAQRTKHEASEKADRIRKEQQAEERRLQEDQKRRDAERIIREQKRIRETEAKKFAAEIASRTNLGLDVNVRGSCPSQSGI